MITINSEINIQYSHSGIFRSYDNSWIHPKRTIDSYEIIFMIEGTAYIAEESTEYELNKNDFLLLKPNKSHYGYKYSENVSFYWLHFFSEDANKLSLPKNTRIAEPHSVIMMLSQILHTSNTPGYSPCCTDLLCALIIQEIIFQSGSVGSANKSAVEFKEWIRINIDKNITLKSISEHFGYHENYISRLFKKSYNMGIKDYIIKTKLDYTKDLLQTTLYTVKQIAHMLGYTDENLFIKFFIYHTDMTPSQYRHMYTETHINTR